MYPGYFTPTGNSLLWLYFGMFLFQLYTKRVKQEKVLFGRKGGGRRTNVDFGDCPVWQSNFTLSSLEAAESDGQTALDLVTQASPSQRMVQESSSHWVRQGNLKQPGNSPEQAGLSSWLTVCEARGWTETSWGPFQPESSPDPMIQGGPRALLAGRQPARPTSLESRSSGRKLLGGGQMWLWESHHCRGTRSLQRGQPFTGMSCSLPTGEQ